MVPGENGDGTAELPLVERDPLLRPWAAELRRRQEKTAALRRALQGARPALAEVAAGHEYFGLHRRPDGGWVFREWAPNATAVSLVGEFSGWEERPAFALRRISAGGVWELELPGPALQHNQLYRLEMHWDGGRGARLPAWCRRVVQDDGTKIFNAQVWAPERPHVWRHPEFRVPRDRAPLIYEAHVGMGQEAERVGTYVEFRERVLPRIVRGGYNTLQLMAVQEHPYYGSFGYHVSNFFAASSRCGTPEELKELVDTAHGLGLAVIMDLVHSHAAKNEVEGLGRFDGTPWQFFHDGARGEHPAWDSRCFNYAKHEVLHFLLSNCRFWLDEYHFDGFRFDGVTSMLYLGHGLNRAFLDYGDYFGPEVDDDALAYLALANAVIHEVRPDAITIAEDVSGQPGLAAPLAAGGQGFDFRLAMGVPDYWIKLLKTQRDEEWHLGRLWHELNNHRADEGSVAYVESHDQAIVGDQTVMFRLMGTAIYTDMSVFSQSLAADRAVALHKMLRLITLATGGGAWLNFMGNEFGHPEWIDFPREGNGWSYHYARRQWSLAQVPHLRYRFLDVFDRAMLHLAADAGLLAAPPAGLLWHHEDDRLLAFARAGLLLVFNFAADRSYADYPIPAPAGSYAVALDTDAAAFGGFARSAPEVVHFTQPEGDGQVVRLYLPSRSAVVLRRRD
ncbi:MAG: alpha amylase C-terminal domain-containing protein [Lentisphaeria bacterium]